MRDYSLKAGSICWPTGNCLLDQLGGNLCVFNNWIRILYV